ncbi:MAG: type II CAAX prenyl endopeptidase Rce1 family protein [Planctomycetia bacterium]
MSGSHRHAGGLRAAIAIARRDLVEFVRDRRTLFITLLLPMVTYPILALSTALGLRTATSELEAQRAPTKIRIAVSGPDAAALADRLLAVEKTTVGAAREGWPAALDIRALPVPDARMLLDQGEVDLWIDSPRGCIAALDAEGTVVLPVQMRPGRPVDRRVAEQFNAVVRSLADDARKRRIESAGLPASVLAPLKTVFAHEQQEMRPPPAHSIMSTLAGGVLVLLAVLTLTGAFYPAIDAIAGEKERGTIETLLIAPCAARDIVFGKFLAVFAVTLATLAANAVSIAATAAVARRFLPAGITMALPEEAVGVILVTVLSFVGLAALAAATCLTVTTASKSGKEAQNTLTPVILLVSALAGTALLPGMRSDTSLAAAPFSGQVLVSRSVFAAGDGGPHAFPAVLGPLAITLLSAAGFTWLLLKATATMLTDEDILFRGGDVAAGGFARPGRRSRPNVVQGVLPIVAGLAALWYVQGVTPDDLARAIPLQQAAAVVLPLAVAAWWQRVDLRETFGLRRPGGPFGVWSDLACLAGAAMLGAGLFVIGAASLLAVKGTAMSAEAQRLSEKILALMQGHPAWMSWALMAALPAICEELLFRGWVLSGFAGRQASWRRAAAAIVAQAALFAIFHLLPERMPQTFLLGLVLGWMTLATGSLLPAVVCHLVHNSMPLVVLSRGMPAWAVPAAIGCVVGGAALLATRARQRHSQEPLAWP